MSLDTRHPILAAGWVVIATLGVIDAAGAQVMNDPTRPPPGFDAGEPLPGDTGGGIMLQSVLITPTRRAAIINGVLVKVGEKYGDAVLVGVAESEAVLKSGGSRQVLKLHPGVDKRESGAKSAASSGAPAR